MPYLTLVGELAQEAHSVDIEYAFAQLVRRATAAASGEALEATRKVFDLKQTLVARPIRLLFDEPHFLSAWLSQHRNDFAVQDGRVRWKRNPVVVLPRRIGCSTWTARTARRRIASGITIASCWPRRPRSTLRCASVRRPR